MILKFTFEKSLISASERTYMLVRKLAPFLINPF